MCATGHMQKSQDNIQESVLSFYHEGLRDRTQFTNLDGKCFYPVSHFLFYEIATFCFFEIVSPYIFQTGLKFQS